LPNKIAVVTGTSKGIGAGIAKKLASKGIEVVVNYSLSQASAGPVVAAITGEKRLRSSAALPTRPELNNSSMRSGLDTKRAIFSSTTPVSNRNGCLKTPFIQIVAKNVSQPR
jgi:NAD(P)-dependent dehydrogenase (short-subunit alcohol dehydrogenase family)